MKVFKYIIIFSVITILFQFAFSREMLVHSSRKNVSETAYPPADSSDMHYPVKQDPVTGKTGKSPLYMKDPPSMKEEVEYDPKTNQYIIKNKAGDREYTPPQYMDLNDYSKYDFDKSLNDYWRERAKSSSMGSGSFGSKLIPSLNINNEIFSTIFGGSTIEIRPTGSAELTFGVLSNFTDDPVRPVKQRRVTSFNFDQNIKLNVTAKVGDKINFDLNYDTKALFAFDNKLALKYEGKEDEILQLLEAGNVNFTVPTTLIKGTQSLFGIKTKLKFGKTSVSAIFSEQKSESKTLSIQGGAQTTKFNFKADEYEENRHFFLAQYFRDHYNDAFKQLPLITSDVNIIKIEVWRTNIGAPTTDNRNIVGLTDLGEGQPSNTAVAGSGNGNVYPNNNANTLLNYLSNKSALRNINQVGTYLQSLNMVSGKDYEKVESARRLNPNSEYTLNSRLGFISLNAPLSSDQVLAVAFQYQIIGDTTIYQVGEFSDQGISDPNALSVKLLKSASLDTKSPLWKLMMKNVYSLSAYGISKQDFRLNILYAGDSKGVPTGYFTDGPQRSIPLIQLLQMDKLDFQMNPYPDGVFDFLDEAATTGGTIQSKNGRIYLPLVEPFGKDLHEILNDKASADKYCFDSLYTLTKAEARQYPDKNKYYLEGSYKSSAGSEIYLGAMNVPEGSIKVMAGGTQLIENVQYTVDYNMGRVTITDEGILSSATPISISYENNSSFNLMTKRMMGLRVEHEFSKDLRVGATIMNLHESPLTQKVNYGDEPISNTIWGVDAAFQKESPFITKMVDALPGIQTKTPSKMSFYGEVAQFLPGHAKAIGKTGTTYIDDFESSKSGYDLRAPFNWFLASTPQGQTQAGMFPEGALTNDLRYGFNRAKLAWYFIDEIFYNKNQAPSNITKDDQSEPYSRQILENEVFPNKDLDPSAPQNIRELNLAFYPNERGPYNYDTAGINSDGTLQDPSSRWGGIMRKIDNPDFEANNYEYIEFWVMDPFINKPNSTGGKLYFNLGDVSEDVLRDGRKMYEQGLPRDENVINVDTTVWGRVPTLQALTESFDNDPKAREFQDVGYDGLRTVDEVSFFQNYLQNILNKYGESSPAYQNALKDPSADNYMYFRGSDWDNNPNGKITQRYKYYNNPDGNSPVTEQNSSDYSTSASNRPNVEDINRDNTLSESENYYQYVIDLNPNQMVIGKNYIADIHVDENRRMPNGTNATTKWYQFKIPIRQPDKVVGNIRGYQSIRFMRMFMKDFNEEIILRFATFQLIRSDWRKYSGNLLSEGDHVPSDESGQTTLNVSAVNIEENGTRSPIPYVVPPGIERQQNYASTSYQQLNEQALSLKVENLIDGDAKAIYKTSDFDMRQFKNLEMFVHAEKMHDYDNLNYRDLTVFIRLGADFTENYYEYEVPLQFTPWYTNSDNPDAIWPENNSFNISLEKFIEAKELRNKMIHDGDQSINYNLPFTTPDGANNITVHGSPSISSVKVIMIGIRNPKKRRADDPDDMLPKSAEIWINELRLTGFNKKPGWAAMGTFRTNLADLGDVSLSGTYSSAGFGTIEQKINEVQKESVSQIDAATNIELGKFLPDKWAVHLPMHFDYSTTIKSPKYNPLDPDVELKDQLEYLNPEEQKDLKNQVQDVIERTNINFVNVRKDRSSDKISEPRIYDIENFDFSYSFSEIKLHNIDVEFDSKQTHRGGFGYNYALKPKNVKPFGKVKPLQNKNLALIRDFNFSYAPKLLSFRTEVFRQYQESKLRNKSDGDIILPVTFFKQFDWIRDYALKWDLASSLMLEYTATANARIDEPPGDANNYSDAERKAIWKNVERLGTKQDFRQNTRITYNIPINKLPFLNWVNSSAVYSANYHWQGQPRYLDSLEMGNTIENDYTFQLSVNGNLATLYNQSKFIKKAYDELNKQMTSKNALSRQPQSRSNQKDTTQKSLSTGKLIGYNVIKFLTGIKSISGSYTTGEGTLLPGFMPDAQFFGMDFRKSAAPGFGFVFGAQPNNLIETAIRNNWLSPNPNMTSAYLKKENTRFSGRVTTEFIRDLKIDLTFDRSYGRNYTAYYRADSTGFIDQGKVIPNIQGSYSISWFSAGTLFTKDNKDHTNDIFNEFLANRIIIAQRLANERAADPIFGQGYDPNKQVIDSMGNVSPDGYGLTSQEVLLYSFLATYSGKNINTMKLTPFPQIPIPNWNLTYTGLTKIPAVRRIFHSVTLSHRYQSIYSISSFQSNVYFGNNPDQNFSNVRDALNNFQNSYIWGQVGIREGFSPLIKIDVSLENSLLINVEFKRTRDLGLSFVNNQLTEINSREYVFGLGYKFKDIQFDVMTPGGSAKKLKSDITTKASFSIRDNITVLRRIDMINNQVSAGSKVISINLSGDYVVSQNLTLRVFWDQVLNRPYISNSYRNSNINAGLSLLISLNGL